MILGYFPFVFICNIFFHHFLYMFHSMMMESAGIFYRIFFVNWSLQSFVNFLFEWKNLFGKNRMQVIDIMYIYLVENVLKTLGKWEKNIWKIVENMKFWIYWLLVNWWGLNELIVTIFYHKLLISSHKASFVSFLDICRPNFKDK